MTSKTSDEAKRNRRNYHLRRNFGITLAEYEELLDFQGGSCALCPTVPTTRSLAVDHDHVTGEVRAILCFSCNKLLVGKMTLDNARKVVSYLEEPPARVFFGRQIFVPEGMIKPKRRRKKRVTRSRGINKGK